MRGQLAFNAAHSLALIGLNAHDVGPLPGPIKWLSVISAGIGL